MVDGTSGWARCRCLPSWLSCRRLASISPHKAQTKTAYGGRTKTIAVPPRDTIDQCGWVQQRPGIVVCATPNVITGAQEPNWALLMFETPFYNKLGLSKPRGRGRRIFVELDDNVSSDHVHGIAITEGDRWLLEFLLRDHPRQQLHVACDRALN